MIHLMKNRIGQKIGFFFLVMIPIVMIGRVSHRWINNKQVPDLLLNSSYNLQSHIPKEDKIIVDGDSTPLVFLYFLNRKGISIDMDSIKLEKLNEYKKNGIKWVLSLNNPGNLKSLNQLNYKSVKKIENFYLI